uniref:Uncharacterized protein n=1 Tax=Ascaris lumbricoides TaxID=6252 RepID=A0A0M3HXV9_ASCLU
MGEPMCAAHDVTDKMRASWSVELLELKWWRAGRRMVWRVWVLANIRNKSSPGGFIAKTSTMRLARCESCPIRLIHNSFHSLANTYAVALSHCTSRYLKSHSFAFPTLQHSLW